MNLPKSERHEIIRNLDYEIEQISKLADGHLHTCLRNKLITPSWCLNFDSVMATKKSYESIMNQIINIQLVDVTPDTLPSVTPDAIINHIANVLIILSLVVEFAEENEERN
jgi:hypothetical protein